MIVTRIDLAAFQPLSPANVEAVRELFNVAAHAPETVGQRRNPIALLDPKLAGAGHAQFATVGGQRTQNWQLVDDARNFRGDDFC